jgi:murein DD-endopeptidase MepM/ murein hydrolase activator NlpD
MKNVSGYQTVLLALCLASAIFASACSLRSTACESRPCTNQATALAEPKVTIDEERIEPDEHKSLPAQSFPAQAGWAEPKGIYHRLRSGESLYSLSRLHHVPLDRLMRVNGITDPKRIRTGTVIFIPRSAPLVSKQAPRTRSLSWPLRGRITARFGPRGKRQHEGIDIDGQGGDEIRAAAAGTVIDAGTRGKYGQMVLIDHGDGLSTLYAHGGKLRVRVGDPIEVGDPLAEVGRSGNASGTHLHFEVRRGGQPVDPMPYLENSTVVTASRAESPSKTNNADPLSEMRLSPIEPGIYETIRTTSVLAEASPFSDKIATILQGTKVRVVESAGEWLEIRSSHGRPPGFINRADVLLARSSG